MIYSHSRLATFEQCPLKFKYRYIDKLETEVQQSIEAFLGSMVHMTLEKLYKDSKFQKLNTLEELLGYYNELWKKNWSEAVQIVKKDYNQENFRKMGEQYLRDYYKRYYPFNQGKIIGLEKKITLSLDESGKYQIQGYIDRLDSTEEGIYEIHDYKTNATIPIEDYLKKDRQLALYSLAVLKDYQDAKKVKLIWHFLSANKEFLVEKTPEELEALRKNIIGLINRIESEKKFNPQKSELCDWCEFKDICPEWEHIVKTEKLEPNKFLNDSGVKLVNKYVELKAKREKFLEEVDHELGQVKEALVKFAEKENVSTVNGSGYTARVWVKEVDKFPNKSEEGREELEKIIRESGLWEELSDLNVFQLSNLFSNGELPEELIKKLEKIAKRERIERIYLNQKDGE